MDIATTSHEADPTYYDVFLSFRGEDTRYSFTDHLYRTLMRTTALQIFRDDDEIDKGRELKPEIDKAIRISKASIVVLSQNYATSTWCLDELSLILEQKKEVNHLVFPVFYHVNPSDIKNQKGTFEIAVKTSGRWTYDNVERWKAALTEVAGLSGFPIIFGLGSETDIIATIVQTIDCKLDPKLVSTPAHLTGIETRAKAINSWLTNEQSSCDVLAICGMGGSGKTTLAQHIYNSNRNFFKSSSFLEEIGQCKQRHQLLAPQNQLLADIIGRKNEMMFSVSEATCRIEKALERKTVFIVLDDIDEPDRLQVLLGRMAFHTGSKIIITTRHQDIQAWFGSNSWRCQVHRHEMMNNDESLELLSWHVFGSKILMEGFKELAVQFAEYCEGNPLALTTLGRLLSVSGPLERNGMIKTWKSTLSSLTSLKGDLHFKVQGVLQRSFDSLPHDSHKELLKHIACFFVGEYKDNVVKILEDEWYAEAGIKVLIDRCLLTISPSDKLMMHQLLQDMVRKIVREKSTDAAEHSRVWCSDESYHVLTKGHGSKMVEGLALDMQKLKKGTTPLAFKTGSLAKMDKLKLLQLKYVKLTGSYKNLPELIWLWWHGCHLKTIRSGLLMNSLVALDMSHGKMEKFELPSVLHSLKILNLKGCDKLVSIRNLYQLPNLQDLILWDCSSLSHICKTIGGLESLALLDLTGCKRLWKVSLIKKWAYQLEGLIAPHMDRGIPQLPLFSLPHALKFLLLNHCDFQHNNDLPVLFSGQPIFYLNLGNNLFDFLPSNIDLNTLRVLEVTSCQYLKSLVCLPSTLEELYTYWCTSLEKISFQSPRFRLRKLGCIGCNQLSEIQGLLKLVSSYDLAYSDQVNLRWRKYYYRTVDLVGNWKIEHISWKGQVLCEYGIMSSYLLPIEDHSLTTFEYTSPSSFLSFQVPLCPKKRSIRGLNVTISYRSSDMDEDTWVLFAKICNTTRSLTWIYNPVVYGKPRVDEDVVWWSYWPIGDMLDIGDEVKVSTIVGNGLMVTECCASLEYMDGEVEQRPGENNTIRDEVIGGDLSEFELSPGVYYLCRRDYLKSATPDWLKMLVGDAIHGTKLQGWSKSYQLLPLTTSFMELKTFRSVIAFPKKIVLKVDLSCDAHKSEHKRLILKGVSCICGIDSIAFDMEKGTLTVTGTSKFDYVGVVKKVKNIVKMVEVISLSLV